MTVGDRFRERENGEVYEIVEIVPGGRLIRPVTFMPGEHPSESYFSPVGVLESNFDRVAP